MYAGSPRRPASSMQHRVLKLKLRSRDITVVNAASVDGLVSSSTGCGLVLAHAVNGAAFLQYFPAIKAEHLAPGETALQQGDGARIVFRLSVGWHDNAAVHQQVVQIARRQAFAVQINGVGNR